jgi:hypothetical protein
LVAISKASNTSLPPISSLDKLCQRVDSKLDIHAMIKKEISMTRFRLTTSLVIFLVSFVGCTTGTYNVATVAKQEAGSGYCHKKLQPVGPSDLARPTQAAGDYIDYYGPCTGPSTAEQIQAQKRFEQFRFGREYMDEG